MSLWDPRNVPPYPPARFTKDEPDISARLRRGTDAPDYETLRQDRSTTTWPTRRPPTATTGCTASSRRPQGGGPGPHFHRAMSEAFFVLSGTVRLYDGTDWVDGHQNDFLYVPPGGIHGFRNDADEPASILMLFAPGAPREPYFEGFPTLADLTDEERREWFVKHDNFFID